jgi:hypothetical protein
MSGEMDQLCRHQPSCQIVREKPADSRITISRSIRSESKTITNARMKKSNSSPTKIMHQYLGLRQPAAAFPKAALLPLSLRQPCCRFT